MDTAQMMFSHCPTMPSTLRLVRAPLITRFSATKFPITFQIRSFTRLHPPFPPKPQVLPLQTNLVHPRPSLLSKLALFRPFSTPAPKKEKHENIYTIPNILTFSRLVSTPIIAYLILTDKPYLATGLLLYAGLTDLVDGWIARRWGLQSVVGTVIDPMADKFLMITLTGALAYTGGMPGNNSVPHSPSLWSEKRGLWVVFCGTVGNDSLACCYNSGKRCWFGY